MEFDGFDWDWGNREKCQKHGVSIRQIEELFRGFALVGPDAWHSAAEERFRAIGRTANQRGIFVAFTLCRLHLAPAGQAAADPPRERPPHASEGGRSL
jgi:uncharacterized DUF497 family protein